LHRLANSFLRICTCPPPNPGYNHTGYAQVLEETTGASTITYTIGDDVIAQFTTGGTTEYLLYDGHGSTRQLIDDTASVVVDPADGAQEYSYDGYGVLLQDSSAQANPGVTPAQSTSLLYAGEQFDTSAQMYYNRARYYNPSNGTFNRVDPYAGNNQDPQSLHKYAYCHNNPINAIDPTGMFSLVSISVNVAIGSILNSIVMPVLAPYIDKAVTLLPMFKNVRNIIKRLVPSAVMGAIGATATRGHSGGGAGFTGSLEVLHSPTTGKWATYGAFGGIVGLGGTGLTGSAKVGLVYGANSSTDYTGFFGTLSIPLRSVGRKFQEEMLHHILGFMNWGLTPIPGAPVGAIDQFRARRLEVASILSNKFNAELNLFIDPSNKTGGFSIGKTLSAGKPLSWSFSFTHYWQLQPSGPVDFKN